MGLLVLLFPFLLHAAELPEILSDRLVSRLLANQPWENFGFLIFNPPNARAFEKLNFAKWASTGKVAILNLGRSRNYMRLTKIFGSPQSSGRSAVEDFLFQLGKRGGLMIFRADNPRLRHVMLQQINEMLEAGKFIGHDGRSYALDHVSFLVEAGETDTWRGSLTVGDILKTREHLRPWQATNFFEAHLFGKKELNLCGPAIRGI